MKRKISITLDEDIVNWIDGSMWENRSQCLNWFMRKALIEHKIDLKKLAEREDEETVCGNCGFIVRNETLEEVVEELDKVIEQENRRKE